mmetsp:Transcript_41965/g.97142  ORF Transcript_41965/g.97142 Transcript_41965/m.97142 type:complete len:1361 (-) Transcript_41965:109-4191(-)
MRSSSASNSSMAPTKLDSNSKTTDFSASAAASAAAAALGESSTTWLKREWRATAWGDELDLCPPAVFLEANALLEQGVGLAALPESAAVDGDAGAAADAAFQVLVVRADIVPRLSACIDTLSHGRFLAEPPASVAGPWAQAPWSQRGEWSTCGEMIANKVEVLIWRAWLARGEPAACKPDRTRQYAERVAGLRRFWKGSLAAEDRRRLLCSGMARALLVATGPAARRPLKSRVGGGGDSSGGGSGTSKARRARVGAAATAAAPLSTAASRDLFFSHRSSLELLAGLAETDSTSASGCGLFGHARDIDQLVVLPFSASADTLRVSIRQQVLLTLEEERIEHMQAELFASCVEACSPSGDAARKAGSGSNGARPAGSKKGKKRRKKRQNQKPAAAMTTPASEDEGHAEIDAETNGRAGGGDGGGGSEDGGGGDGGDSTAAGELQGAPWQRVNAPRDQRIYVMILSLVCETISKIVDRIVDRDATRRGGADPWGGGHRNGQAALVPRSANLIWGASRETDCMGFGLGLGSGIVLPWHDANSPGLEPFEAISESGEAAAEPNPTSDEDSASFDFEFQPSSVLATPPTAVAAEPLSPLSGRPSDLALDESATRAATVDPGSSTSTAGTTAEKSAVAEDSAAVHLDREQDAPTPALAHEGNSFNGRDASLGEPGSGGSTDSGGTDHSAVTAQRGRSKSCERGERGQIMRRPPEFHRHKSWCAGEEQARPSSAPGKSGTEVLSGPGSGSGLGLSTLSRRRVSYSLNGELPPHRSRRLQLDTHDDMSSMTSDQEDPETPDPPLNSEHGELATPGLPSRLEEDNMVLRDMVLRLEAEVAKLRNVVAVANHQGGVQMPVPPVSQYHWDSRAMHREVMSDDGSGFVGPYTPPHMQPTRQTHYAGYHFANGGVPPPMSIPPVLSAPAASRSAPAVSLLSDFKSTLSSRLSIDISRFLDFVDKEERRLVEAKMASYTKTKAVVQSLWPRAQVQIYGSFVTGLSLPRSDVDLVISLPKVQKDTPGEHAGVLEGRNAIKETWQQNLARCLRGESWVDTSSIKIISRTAIPVMKLKTTGTEGVPSICFDVSFEDPQHRGLAACDYVRAKLEELPAIRPLVLVLKQLLGERGLSEAYSGGLSSYALFLMVTRYLEEQDHQMDVGALLMGFLSFYAQNFDPRRSGISVPRRCYFGRTAGFAYSSPSEAHGEAGVVCQFDPLFIEDPLCKGNNAGRNCFRIITILKTWSDALAALTRAVDMDSFGTNKRPLLAAMMSLDYLEGGALYEAEEEGEDDEHQAEADAHHEDAREDASEDAREGPGEKGRGSGGNSPGGELISAREGGRRQTAEAEAEAATVGGAGGASGGPHKHPGGALSCS